MLQVLLDLLVLGATDAGDEHEGDRDLPRAHPPRIAGLWYPRARMTRLIGSLSLLLACAALSACRTGDNTCNAGTVFVSVGFDAASAAADSYSFNITVDGVVRTTTFPHVPGTTSDTVEVSFSGVYPTGKSVVADVAATLRAAPWAAAARPARWPPAAARSRCRCTAHSCPTRAWRAISRRCPTWSILGMADLTTIPVTAYISDTNAPKIGNGWTASCVLSSTDLSPTSKCWTIQWAGYTYWAMSHDDNRFSFNIVAVNASGVVTDQLEVGGARYLWNTSVDEGARSVSFHGQADNAVTLGWNQLALLR